MVRSIVIAFAAFALVAGVANGMAIPSISAPDANTVAKLAGTRSGNGDLEVLSEADAIQKHLMRQRRLVSEEL